MVRIAVGIEIVLSPDACLCAVKVFVLQMPWKVRRTVFLHVCHCRIDRFVGAVGLWRSGEEYDCLRNGNACLGQPQLKGAVYAGFRDDNCLGICQTHVLCGNHQQPPADRQQIICRKQPCRIVQGCVFV